MSDIMRPIPFAELMDWVLTEYAQQGTIFGVGDIYKHTAGKTLPIFTEQIETPFGPAAGPHTQLAQNLIAAYAGGSRFFEVKTVQIIDGEDLPVSKPCIKAEDECYNVEWSTELHVPQAFEEYVKAWFALKLISRMYGLGSENGFVFNMSVGYDLAGIQSEKVNTYIEGMKDASTSKVWAECVEWAKANLNRLNGIDAAYIDGINPHVCTSITLSTLHGCPPDEIERIATYLINEKKLNTYIKCNPTLLGYEFARKTLDDMGYDYIVFDDHHFKGDLQFEDAIPMFNRLLDLAASNNVEFGIKLTNTFPVTIAAGELPGEEMYMSGKSLYPLSISLAQKVEKEFGGKLRVSYSGGADYFNIDRIFNTGIWPITLATTLLKPGGYNRLRPMADKLVAMDYVPFAGVDMEKLGALVDSVKTDAHHVKPIKPLPSRKMKQDVPLIDCFVAPCEEAGCPIHQDIPTYIQLVGEGKLVEALQVICEKNPLPFITGTICSHRCMTKCTRNFYEESVQIRAAKLAAAEGGYDVFLAGLKAGSPRSENVAIVGGGPAGMAAAYFLAKAGAKATIFEKRNALGGIVKHVIPGFRISDEAIAKDAALLEKLGVEVKLNTTVANPAELLGQGYTHVILANGAWNHGALKLEGGEALNVLEYLDRQKNAPETLNLGNDVVVIGGGNTAMDAARAAKRAGAANVRLVYRRSKRYMPADEEELELALADGVEFCELLAPVALKDGKLVCDVMRLGAPDASGRRSPEATGETTELPASCVIAAIGEKVDTATFLTSGIAVDEKGKAKVDADCKAENGIYVVGDAKRGPATVVEAIADATAAAMNILASAVKTIDFTAEASQLKAKRSLLGGYVDAKAESDRCLGCSAVCENCVDVCPNRANLAIKVPGMAKEQVVHVDKMCNECGNCAVFCPYASSPYKDKFTVFASEADMADSQNPGFCVLDAAAGKVKIRLGDAEYETVLAQDTTTYGPIKALIETILKDYAYCL